MDTLKNNVQANPALANKLNACLLPISGFIILLGATVAIGWIFDVEILKSGSSQSLSMRPNIALGLILTGLALRLLRSNNHRFLYYLLCVCTAFVGAASLFEYILNWDMGLTTFGFDTPTTPIGIATPERMDLTSSLLLSMSGIGLVFLKNKRMRYTSYALFFIISSVSFLSVLGYMYGISDLKGIRAYTEMGLHTSIAFILISLYVYIVDLNKITSLSTLLSHGPGGYLARRMIITAVVLPTLLGAGKLFGENLGYFSTRFGTAILTGANIVALIVAILAISTMLEKAEFRRKKATEKNKKLENQNTLRDRFVSTLSHDLRNPLNVIKLNAEVILSESQKGNSTEGFARDILKSSNRIDQMIESLLDAGKIEAGGALQINRKPGNLSPVIEEAVADMRPLHDGEIVYRSKGSLQGNWDNAAIRRALDNLLSNAIKYGERYGKITVKSEISSSKLRLSVHNFGGYIPEKKRERLFSTYHRLETAANSETQGWGLGLTLVKGVAQAHGGEVWVESSPTIGTKFTMEIKSA